MGEKLGKLNSDMVPGPTVYKTHLSEADVEAKLDHIKSLYEELLGSYSNWNADAKNHLEGLVYEVKFSQPAYDRVPEDKLPWWQKD